MRGQVVSIKIFAKAQPTLKNIAGINDPVTFSNPAEIIPNPKYPIPRLKFMELNKIPFPGMVMALFLIRLFKT